MLDISAFSALVAVIVTAVSLFFGKFFWGVFKGMIDGLQSQNVDIRAQQNDLLDKISHLEGQLRETLTDRVVLHAQREDYLRFSSLEQQRAELLMDDVERLETLNQTLLDENIRLTETVELVIREIVSKLNIEIAEDWVSNMLNMDEAHGETKSQTDNDRDDNDVDPDDPGRGGRDLFDQSNWNTGAGGL